MGKLVVLWVFLTASFLPSALSQTAAMYHQRADQAVQSFLLKFWNGGQQYLRNRYPSDGSLTGYWTYAHGWAAVLDAVERTGGQQYSGFIESFYLGQNERGWSSDFYDDECWMIFALVQAYDLTGEAKYLERARNIFSDVQSAWDTTCCGPIPGGVWWDRAHSQKATASNAGAALAAALLYRRTNEADYLSFSQMVYAFWRANMVNSTTYQVCDHINPDGTKVWWKFTYNEGLMLGAALELYRATANNTYLTHAHQYAGFIIANEVTPTIYGNVLYDGSNAGCGGDCHQFKGPAYRYLRELYELDPSKTQYLSVLKASADAVWNLARDTSLDVFAVNWAGPSQASGDQGQNNSACIALNLFAQQFGPYPGSTIPPNRYEAENSVLRHVGLEANYGDFTGWAYLAGWNGNGQGVEFKVHCAVAGPRKLTFRYAAGAGNATRQISINGVNAFSNLSFTGTGAWSSYNTNIITGTLPVGESTIAVMQNNSLGNGNFLNLDHLIVHDVVPPAILDAKLLSSKLLRLTWSAVSNQTYRVQFSDSLLPNTWSNLTGNITASGNTASADDVIEGQPHRYYRIVTP